MVNIGYKNDLSLDEKVIMVVVRLAEFFKKNFANIFKNYNLTFPQYNFLRVLDSWQATEYHQQCGQNHAGLRCQHDGHCQTAGKKWLSFKEKRSQQWTYNPVEDYTERKGTIKKHIPGKGCKHCPLHGTFFRWTKKEVLFLLRSIIRENNVY